MDGQRKIFFFGYGYVADYLVRTLKAKGGWSFAGTTRDFAKAEAMEKIGVDAYLFGPDQPLADTHAVLNGVTHVLVSTPPDDAGDPVFRLHGEDLAELSGLEWLAYLSTTGVYGDRDGDWVDENSEVRPTTRRGTRRLRAEQQWGNLHAAMGVPLHIFRLAGIYGPGRSALDAVRAGAARRIFKPGQAFSRIHVEDIVQVLMASIARPNPGGVYNLADDLPAASHEVIAHACEVLGKDIPPLLDFASADLAPITLSFYSDNKRIRNDRIKDELGVRLRYPTYQDGILACLRVDQEGDEGGLAPHWFVEGREIISAND